MMEGIPESCGAGCCSVCWQPFNPSKTKIKAVNKPKAGCTCNQSRKPAIKNQNVKNVDDSEIVLVTECGHFFHKVCIVEYATNYKVIFGQTFSECPICGRRIIISRAIQVDLAVHNGFNETAEKEYKMAMVMNQELRGQLLRAAEKHNDIMNRLVVALEDFEAAESDYIDVRSLLIEQMLAAKAIEMMQISWWEANETIVVLKQENFQLTTIFVYLAADHIDDLTKDPSKQHLSIPSQLLPYLLMIQSTPRLMQKCTQILSPIPLPIDDDEIHYRRAPTQDEAIKELLTAIEKLRKKLPPNMANEVKPNPNLMIESPNSESDINIQTEPVIVKPKSIADIVSTFKRNVVTAEILPTPEKSTISEQIAAILASAKRRSTCRKQIPGMTLGWSLPVTPHEIKKATMGMLSTVGIEEQELSNSEQKSPKDYYALSIKCQDMQTKKSAQSSKCKKSVRNTQPNVSDYNGYEDKENGSGECDDEEYSDSDSDSECEESFEEDDHCIKEVNCKCRTNNVEEDGEEVEEEVEEETDSDEDEDESCQNKALSASVTCRKELEALKMSSLMPNLQTIGKMPFEEETLDTISEIEYVQDTENEEPVQKEYTVTGSGDSNSESEPDVETDRLPCISAGSKSKKFTLEELTRDIQMYSSGYGVCPPMTKYCSTGQYTNPEDRGLNKSLGSVVDYDYNSSMIRSSVTPDINSASFFLNSSNNSFDESLNQRKKMFSFETGDQKKNCPWAPESYGFLLDPSQSPSSDESLITRSYDELFLKSTLAPVIVSSQHILRESSQSKYDSSAYPSPVVTAKSGIDKNSDECKGFPEISSPCKLLTEEDLAKLCCKPPIETVRQPENLPKSRPASYFEKACTPPFRFRNNCKPSSPRSTSKKALLNLEKREPNREPIVPDFHEPLESKTLPFMESLKSSFEKCKIQSPRIESSYNHQLPPHWFRPCSPPFGVTKPNPENLNIDLETKNSKYVLLSSCIDGGSQTNFRKRADSVTPPPVGSVVPSRIASVIQDSQKSSMIPHPSASERQSRASYVPQPCTKSRAQSHLSAGIPFHRESVMKPHKKSAVLLNSPKCPWTPYPIESSTPPHAFSVTPSRVDTVTPNSCCWSLIANPTESETPYLSESMSTPSPPSSAGTTLTVSSDHQKPIHPQPQPILPPIFMLPFIQDPYSNQMVPVVPFMNQQMSPMMIGMPQGSMFQPMDMAQMQQININPNQDQSSQTPDPLPWEYSTHSGFGQFNPLFAPGFNTVSTIWGSVNNTNLNTHTNGYGSNPVNKSNHASQLFRGHQSCQPNLSTVNPIPVPAVNPNNKTSGVANNIKMNPLLPVHTKEIGPRNHRPVKR